MRRWLVVAAVLVVATAVVAALLGDGRPAAPPTDTPTTRPPDVLPTQPTEPGPTVSPCPSADPVALTVLTLNLHAARTKAGRLDLARVAAELRAWRADVVLLQEVDRGRDRSDLVHQARWLGRRLGMTAVYGPNRRLHPGTSGNAVLSRHPVVSSHNHPLPRRPGLYRRGLLRVTLDVEGHRVDVFATHLEHASVRVRREQARVVAGRVRRSPRPVVVAGDLNAEPGMPPLRMLARAGLVDTWSAAGRGDGLTVPAYAPRRRIDFVLADRSFVPVAAEVLVSLVSDHRAVRAELLLVPGACR